MAGLFTGLWRRVFADRPAPPDAEDAADTGGPRRAAVLQRLRTLYPDAPDVWLAVAADAQLAEAAGAEAPPEPSEVEETGARPAPAPPPGPAPWRTPPAETAGPRRPPRLVLRAVRSLSPAAEPSLSAEAARRPDRAMPAISRPDRLDETPERRPDAPVFEAPPPLDAPPPRPGPVAAEAMPAVPLAPPPPPAANMADRPRRAAPETASPDGPAPSPPPPEPVGPLWTAALRAGQRWFIAASAGAAPRRSRAGEAAAQALPPATRRVAKAKATPAPSPLPPAPDASPFSVRPNIRAARPPFGEPAHTAPPPGIGWRDEPGRDLWPALPEIAAAADPGEAAAARGRSLARLQDRL